MCISPAEVWNEHWTQILADSAQRRRVQVGFHARMLTEITSELRERNVRRLLLPGNGCSLLPHAMVHLGFEVTVVDVSSVANDAVAGVCPTPGLIAAFLPVYRTERDRYTGSVQVVDREAGLQRANHEAVPGGKLTLITADIRDWEPQEPLDAVFDDRLAMLLPTSDWPEIAGRYYRWLNPQGVAILITLDMGGTSGQDVAAMRTPFEDAFMVAGFREYRFRGRPTPSVPSRGPARWFRRFRGPQEEPPAVPPSDGKLVCFWHGSG